MACDTTHVPARTLGLDELRDRLAPLGARDVTPLTGGASSLTFSAALPDDERVVVKVAPPGLAPVRNRDVLRQARVLRALDGAGLPVPAVLAEDAGDPPDVPPLFVMAFVAGTSVEPLFDHEGSDEPVEIVAERLRDAARVLGALHTVDPTALALDDEPVVVLGAEIDRWSDALETVDAELAPGWRDVATALRAHTPEPAPPAIVHGDFRLGNLLSVGPTVTAIVDWEIWTVGDPRVDLGWFLANADPATYRRATRDAGHLPTTDELLAGYVAAWGRAVDDVAWFRALACFKSTATWSLIVKHDRRRDHPDPEVEAMTAVLPDLLAQARTWLD
jgi:aminoglycoside phosphotransferase (APT) family kinase protein